MVLDVIRRSDPLHWDLIAAVVMDDHVHVLGVVHLEVTARQTVQAMKSVASHELCRESARRAPVWQSEYFDRWMKSSAQTAACKEYVLRNPERRWPDLDRYPWLYATEPPKAR